MDERAARDPGDDPGEGLGDDLGDDLGAGGYDDSVPPGAPGPHGHRPSMLPGDGGRMGLDRRTEEGALIEFAGALDARRPAHRVVAWVLIAAFGLPALLALWQLLGIVLGGVRGWLLP